ncbi:MAG: transposase [Bacteroidota bacterium]
MHVLVSFPSIVEAYSNHFEHCFTPTELIHFKKVVSGFLLSEQKTVSGINRLFINNQCNQSTLNRFLNKSSIDLDAINEARMAMLQSRYPTQLKPGRPGGGVISIDNSLLKHYGKGFDDIYYHYDYVNKCFSWAHDLVTLYYSDDQTDYPVDWHLWQPPDWEAVARFFMQQNYTINSTHWERRKEQPQKWRNYIRSRYRAGRKKYPEVLSIYKTKLHLAADLLRRFRAKYPEQAFPVALDSGYTSPELCEVIQQELQLDYVGSLKEEQRIADPEGGNMIRLGDFVQRLRERQADPNQKNLVQKTAFTFKGQKQYLYTYCKTVRVSKYEKKQRLVVSFLQEDLSDRPNLTICNRTDWHASGIMRIRRHRWPVETYHQEGKAEGLEKYEVRNYKAIQTHIALVTVAFSMLKFLVHDSDLLSDLQQRLHTESKQTLPFLRRLLQAEGLFNLMEYVFVGFQKGYTVDQLYQPFATKVAY